MKNLDQSNTHVMKFYYRSKELDCDKFIYKLESEGVTCNLLSKDLHDWEDTYIEYEFIYLGDFKKLIKKVKRYFKNKDLQVDFNSLDYSKNITSEIEDDVLINESIFLSKYANLIDEE